MKKLLLLLLLIPNLVMGEELLLQCQTEIIKQWCPESGACLDAKKESTITDINLNFVREINTLIATLNFSGSEINITANNANTVISDRLFSLKDKFKDAENFDDSFKLDRYTGKLLFRREMNTNKSTETTTMTMKGNCTKIKNNIKKF